MRSRKTATPRHEQNRFAQLLLVRAVLVLLRRKLR